MIRSILISSIVAQISGYEYESPLLYASFPDGFQWGAATAAYQIEGGWKDGGKGLSIWDKFTDGTDNIADGSDGKVACDSYHKYKEDVALLKNMNMTHYRFSIAWTRIQPSGQGAANEEGVSYYKALIAELLANGITPVVTLYHWDLPQAVEDQGGWLTSEVAEWFAEYARICFREFGNEVKQWITINEPAVISLSGYGNGGMAPGLTGMGTNVYVVSHNLIRAHAKAYRVYQEEFAADQQGRVGITISCGWSEPEDLMKPEDIEAAERRLQFDLGWFTHPIIVDGKYPEVMRTLIDEKSAAQGFPQSRLPQFTPEESEEIKGSTDFLGINHYSSSLVFPKNYSIEDVSYYADRDLDTYQDPRWYTAASSWLKVAPFGIRKLMNWIKNEYGDDLEIFITENGTSDFLGNLDDLQRIYFFKHYINNLLKAIVLDNVKIGGYYAWSLMDNFEWSRGYTEKFGVHFVDFNDPDRPRTPKASSQYLAKLATNNAFVETDSPC